nr:aldehyde dehydrogenase family protein [Acidimicrobiia bacterium]
LDAGERWLVEPQQRDDEGRLWSPGVRLGVADGSWFHRTECFGPVLGVMRARDLDHAIELQNAVDFGLTGGIHSLDPHEVDRWLERVEVGNAYVNRHITGAVVRRQPFGGWKRSAVGPGAKAGGPGYTSLFTSFDGPAWTTEDATGSYAAAWRDWFSAVHDPSALRSERNALRYRPLGHVVVRYDDTTPDDDIVLAQRAAAAAGVRLELAARRHRSDDQLAATLQEEGERIDRLRLLCDADDSLLRACHERHVAVDREPISRHGRIELAHWVVEQSISETAHRYGRLLESTGVDRLRAR